jgi:hypothetical protein
VCLVSLAQIPSTRGDDFTAYQKSETFPNVSCAGFMSGASSNPADWLMATRPAIVFHPTRTQLTTRSQKAEAITYFYKGLLSSEVAWGLREGVPPARAGEKHRVGTLEGAVFSCRWRLFRNAGLLLAVMLEMKFCCLLMMMHCM